MLTERQAGWVASSERRVRVVRQHFLDRAAADERLTAPPILPPDERDERLWGERNVCKACGRCLRRTDNPLRECGACEANSGPVQAEPKARITYGCGCK